MTGIYQADDYLGTNALLLNDAYTDTATALEDSILCIIPKEQIDHRLNLYPDVAREFIKLLANDIREKEEQLLQFAYNSVRKKMAETIVKLSRQQNSENKTIHISRENLASLSGMATETVSRTLSDFKNEGLIDKKGSAITILNIDRLARMKN